VTHILKLALNDTFGGTAKNPGTRRLSERAVRSSAAQRSTHRADCVCVDFDNAAPLSPRDGSATTLSSGRLGWCAMEQHRDIVCFWAAMRIDTIGGFAINVHRMVEISSPE
jgi:hypothetical protein